MFHCSENSDLAHNFVLCQKIQGFWCGVLQILSEVLRVNLEPDPVLIVLGHFNYINLLNNAPPKFLIYCLITAKENLVTVLEKG